MKKPKPIRTYGPIHFEDLDPHRFEDLIREIIYDYKNWQSIEATGKSGSDDGFDIRAYEKVTENQEKVEDIDEDEIISPMNGNMWMVQVKREKEIGPKRVREIISEVDKNNPPYGYILAASANFSKKSYDAFREELVKKGVTEFYLLGKSELEDMLHLPKNDRILFTFFGYSLSLRQRSKTTEIRQRVNNKNKLIKILGEDISDFGVSILIRDINDDSYPNKDFYQDFEKNPRWKEFRVVQHHPLGLIIRRKKFFAYTDTKKKEFDFFDKLNLVILDKHEYRDPELREKIENCFSFFQRSKQSYFFENRLLNYKDIFYIDPIGDKSNSMPHIFVDFNKGVFSGSLEYLSLNNEQIFIEKYKKIKKFPDKIPELKIGKIYDKDNFLNKNLISIINSGRDYNYSIYDLEGKFSFLKVKDVLVNKDDQGTKIYLQITYIEKIKIKDYLNDNVDKIYDLKMQIGEEFREDDEVFIYEFKKIYDFTIERLKNKKNTPSQNP